MPMLQRHNKLVCMYICAIFYMTDYKCLEILNQEYKYKCHNKRISLLIFSIDSNHCLFPLFETTESRSDHFLI